MCPGSPTLDALAPDLAGYPIIISRDRPDVFETLQKNFAEHVIWDRRTGERRQGQRRKGRWRRKCRDVGKRSIGTGPRRHGHATASSSVHQERS